MLTPWYITGFCDSAAAFTYSRTGGTFGLYFAIKQKTGNLQILETIREYYNFVGDIYRIGPNSIYYRVNRIEQLQRIIQHFDKYPLQNPRKAEAYSIWREMVVYKQQHFRSIDYAKLRALAEKLSQVTQK